MRYKTPLVLFQLGIVVAASFSQPPFPPVTTQEPPLGTVPKTNPLGPGGSNQPGKKDVPAEIPPLGGQGSPGGGLPKGSDQPRNVPNPLPELPGGGGLGSFPGGSPMGGLGGNGGIGGGETAPPPLGNAGKNQGNGKGTIAPDPADRPPTLFPQDPAFPNVHLRTRVVGVANPNEEVTYRLGLSNPTEGNAHKVQVRQSLPAQGQFIKATPPPTTQSESELVWQLGTLEARTDKEIVVVFKADGTGDLVSTARVQFEYGQTVRTKMESALRVRMSPDTPDSMMANETFTLTTEISNNGQTPLENVKLTQTIPDGLEFLSSNPNESVNSNPTGPGANLLEWRLGTLDPGKQKAVRMKVLAKRSGSFSTKATVVSGPQKKELDLPLTVGKAGLEISGGGPDRRIVGRPGIFYISVINRGTIPAANVKITSKLEPEIEFLSADSGGSAVQGEARWNIPSLRAGEKRTVSMVVRGLKAGKLEWRAEAIADRVPSGAQVVKVTHFTPAKGLMVEVDKTAEPISVGNETSFLIKLLNYGTQNYKGPVVTITLPPELQLIDAQGSTGSSKVGPTIVFAPIPTLGPGPEPTFRVSAKVIKGGEPRLRVEVKSQDLPDGDLLFEEGIHLATPSAPANTNPSAPMIPALSGGGGFPNPR